MNDDFYKVGDKFLIEIGEKYKSTAMNENEGILTDEQENAPEFLYRIKGFNSLVFNKNGFSKLEKYNDKSDYISPEQAEKIKEESKTEGLEEGLLQGRQEMLDVLRKILISDLNGGFHINELREIFGTDNRLDIIQKYKAENLVCKINEYEKQKEESKREKVSKIKLGDEISYYSIKDDKDLIGIVVNIENSMVDAINEKGETFKWDVSEIEATGRKFPQFEKLFTELKEKRNIA